VSDKKGDDSNNNATAWAAPHELVASFSVIPFLKACALISFQYV